MQNAIITALAASAVLLLTGGCVTKLESDPGAPTGPPSATITVDEWQAAYDVAAATGKGTIRFNGQTRPFLSRPAKSSISTPSRTFPELIPDCAAA
ncbi:MAG: hypothetical protein MUC40_03300 [Akkermansiaceae bacterium]|nr:hypothetical protein [Akkermansiaceae bacterium]